MASFAWNPGLSSDLCLCLLHFQCWQNCGVILPWSAGDISHSAWIQLSSSVNKVPIFVRSTNFADYIRMLFTVSLNKYIAFNKSDYVYVIDPVGYLPLSYSRSGKWSKSWSGVVLDRSPKALYLEIKLLGYSPDSPNVAFVCPGLILSKTNEIISCPERYFFVWYFGFSSLCTPLPCVANFLARIGPTDLKLVVYQPSNTICRTRYHGFCTLGLGLRVHVWRYIPANRTK
jgi:hypothetical protein